MIWLNESGSLVLNASDYIWIRVEDEVTGEMVECVWHELTDEKPKRVKLKDVVVYAKEGQEEKSMGIVHAIGPVEGYCDARSVYFADRIE